MIAGPDRPPGRVVEYRTAETLHYRLFDAVAAEVFLQMATVATIQEGPRHGLWLRCEVDYLPYEPFRPWPRLLRPYLARRPRRRLPSRHRVVWLDAGRFPAIAETIYKVCDDLYAGTPWEEAWAALDTVLMETLL